MTVRSDTYSRVDLTGTLSVNGVLAMVGNTYASYYSGTIAAAGDVSVTGTGYGGSTALSFVGTSSATYSQDAGAGVPPGLITVSKSGGAALNLSSAASFTGSGQGLTITSGTINMNNHDLTINAALTLQSGTTVNRGTGPLTYGSLVNNGGTIN